MNDPLYSFWSDLAERSSIDNRLDHNERLGRGTMLLEDVYEDSIPEVIDAPPLGRLRLLTIKERAMALRLAR